MNKIYIATKTAGPFYFSSPDTSLVLVKDVLLKSSTTGILATGDAANRELLVAGEVSARETGVVFVSGAATDINASIVVAAGGSITAGRAGISGVAIGLDIINGGAIQAKLTGVSSTGSQAKVSNDGTITSVASNAIDVRGDFATVLNNGRLLGHRDTIKSTGDFALIKNNGMIGSATADGVVAKGQQTVISNSGSIGTRGDGIFATGAGQTIVNTDKIGSGGSAIVTRGEGSVVTNAGTLNAGNAGIAIYGDGTTATNTKSIEVGGSAIRIDADDVTVGNSGSIKGAIGIDVSGRGVEGSNSGTITSWKGAAVDLTGTLNATFSNSGTIAASSGNAIKGGSGAQSLKNTGTIKGDVDLGGGNDHFDGRGGVVMGHIAGDKGNDTYVVSNTKTLIVEERSGGSDTVEATVSYVLQANFENLKLLGSAAINATGNEAANKLHGNAALNHIDGKSGNDVIWGHAGNDVLTGGAGRDQFVFEVGDGKDVITDFNAKGSSHDVLNFRDFENVSTYREIMADHVKQIGTDVLITIDSDSVMLRNVKLAALDKSDFLF